MGETTETREKIADKIADVEEKVGDSLEGGSEEATLDDLMVLKIRLALTDTIDYPLPPVIGD